MNKRDDERLWASGNWMLRSSNDGVSYGGYKRKRVGAWNDAGDKWTGIPTCEECGGFFGITSRYYLAGMFLSRCTFELCETRGDVVAVDGDKVCAQSYRVIAVNEAIPDRYWNACGYRIARDGDTISPREGERWLCLSGHVTVRGQTGGVWWAYGRSEQTVIGQRGGVWWAYGRSTQTVSGQKGGWWYAYGRSSQTISGQVGGEWAGAYGTTQTVVADKPEMEI